MDSGKKLLRNHRPPATFKNFVEKAREIMFLWSDTHEHLTPPPPPRTPQRNRSPNLLVNEKKTEFMFFKAVHVVRLFVCLPVFFFYVSVLLLKLETRTCMCA